MDIPTYLHYFMTHFLPMQPPCHYHITIAHTCHVRQLRVRRKDHANNCKVHMLSKPLGSPLAGICLVLGHPSLTLVNAVLYFIPSVYDWHTGYFPCLFSIRCLIMLMHTSCQENNLCLFSQCKSCATTDCEQIVNETGMTLALRAHVRMHALCRLSRDVRLFVHKRPKGASDRT